MNLLENAVRHASQPTRVCITAAVVTNTVEIRVADDGPGIRWDAAERLFLPHVRGMTEGAGAGLGLAIARGIVEAHGGAIRFEEVPRRTCVVVCLPIEPAAVQR